jgi:hypothetical protein
MGFEGAQPSFDGTAMNNIFIQDEVESDSKDNQCLGETTKVKSWDEMFDHLKEYAEEHGDTNVPTQQGPLGRWVSTQRTFFDRLEKGKEKYPLGTCLSWVEWKEKVHMRRDALEAIGFEWHHLSEIRWNQWNNMFQELVKFKETHGHTNVSQRNKPLGQWVNTQRKNLVYREKGKRSHITQHRMDMLNEIEFDWVVQDNETRWNQKFGELRVFQKMNGHANVPRSQGSLGMWVRKQRRSYKLLSNGESSPLTEERFHALNNIGFQWNVARGRKKC